MNYNHINALNYCNFSVKNLAVFELCPLYLDYCEVYIFFRTFKVIDLCKNDHFIFSDEFS